ncbi:MAG: HD domain-containing protein [Lachnospiraceae bacterium]|nr:HD domain-containing protein [Lachnospiraceae bacterium]
MPAGTDPKFLVEEQAIRYAAQAHRGTFRKGSGLPYIVHPMEVMMICKNLSDDPDVIAAAALHDVVEDTPHTLRDLEEAFGTRIAALVGLESENKREDQPKSDTWKIRKHENLERERTAPIEAKMIMLADKVSNMRATVSDYLEGTGDIWSKFNMKDPGEQEWYYRSVAQVLSDLSDTPEYAEYVRMLDMVFK